MSPRIFIPRSTTAVEPGDLTQVLSPGQAKAIAAQYAEADRSGYLGRLHDGERVVALTVTRTILALAEDMDDLSGGDVETLAALAHWATYTALANVLTSYPST